MENAKTFEEFCSSLIDEMSERGIDASLDHVRRYNCSYTTIRRPDKKIMPSICLENLYEDYISTGKTFSETADYALYLIDRAMEDLMKSYIPDDYADELSDYETAKTKLFIAVINYEYFKDLQHCMPHKKIGDLIVFAKLITSGTEMTNVDNSLAELWNVTPETIIDDAMENAPGIYPATSGIVTDLITDLSSDAIMSILTESGIFSEEADVFRTLVENKHKEFFGSKPVDMYCLSNEERFLGAAVMAYPGFLKEFADKLGADLYIIPSSIHEIIAVPVGHSVSVKKLRDDLVSVNSTYVSEEEWLSDNVYYYSREEDEICILNEESCSIIG